MIEKLKNIQSTSQLLAGDPERPDIDIPVIEPQPTRDLNPFAIIERLVEWGLWIAWVLAFGFLIYGGVLFITAKGDADQATKARNTILYALLGILIIGISFALINWAAGGDGAIDLINPSA